MIRRSAIFLFYCVLFISAATLSAKSLRFEKNGEDEIAENVLPVLLGEFKDVVLRVRNDGNAGAAMITGSRTGGPDADDFSVVNYTGGDIPKGYGGEIKIRFRPMSPGANKSATIIIRFQDGSGKDSLIIHVNSATPKPEGLRIRPDVLDFKKVTSGGIYTRSVTIHNTNSVIAQVNSLGIVNNDGRFIILRPQDTLPGGRFKIEPKDSVVLTVQFSATNANLFHPKLAVAFRAFDDNYTVPIKGEVENPLYGLIFTFSPSNDFGEVDTGTVGTSVVTITNNGNDPITLSKFGFKNYQEIFKTDISTAEIQVPANQTKTFTISFKPTDSIIYSDTFEAFDGKKAVSFAVIGKGRIPIAPSYSTILSLDDLTVPVGEQFILPVRFKNESEFPANTRKNFRIELRFTASVLYYPAADDGALPIENGERITAVTSMYDSGNSTNELVRLTFKTALGDMPFGHIRITDFTWLDDAGNKITTNATFDTAVITITGTEGQLVNSNKKQLTLSASPNPVIGGNLELEFTNYQQGATLKIYNTQGVLVRDLSGEISATATSFKITCPTTDIPEGAYFCRLTSGENSIVRTIFIQK